MSYKIVDFPVLITIQ